MRLVSNAYELIDVVSKNTAWKWESESLSSTPLPRICGNVSINSSQPQQSNFIVRCWVCVCALYARRIQSEDILRQWIWFPMLLCWKRWFWILLSSFVLLNDSIFTSIYAVTFSRRSLPWYCDSWWCWCLYMFTYMTHEILGFITSTVLHCTYLWENEKKNHSRTANIVPLGPDETQTEQTTTLCTVNIHAQ